MPSAHLAQFSTCLSNVTPYGLLSGGKIFSEVAPDIGDGITENNKIQETAKDDSNKKYSLFIQVSQ
jgi:cytidylate kinase